MTQQVLGGRWEGILQHTAELSGKEMIVTVIEPRNSSPPEEATDGQTLLSFLRDSVGAFRGRDGYSSEVMNECVGEHVTEKHQACGTMLDFFSGYVGVINSSEFVPGVAKMSEEIDRKFAEGMLKK